MFSGDKFNLGYMLISIAGIISILLIGGFQGLIKPVQLISYPVVKRFPFMGVQFQSHEKGQVIDFFVSAGRVQDIRFDNQK